ncbi:outer membrane protein assembly factor BamB family protein [Longirhabdus pacifica]|uniref:outer membrane protein assembly factor BamB family protein n=1 Tax=Longirhabdus pacifica TaxID=2305227 RepID=UPI001008B3E7|nr:PQQ-binding-like beta-propeller repeat protein [Longirhabdus pacifica]
MFENQMKNKLKIYFFISTCGCTILLIAFFMYTSLSTPDVLASADKLIQKEGQAKKMSAMNNMNDQGNQENLLHEEGEYSNTDVGEFTPSELATWISSANMTQTKVQEVLGKAQDEKKDRNKGETIWRYDFDSTTYSPVTHNALPDFAGIRDGDISSQLFLHWDDNNKLVTYRIYFKDDEDQIQLELGLPLANITYDSTLIHANSSMSWHIGQSVQVEHDDAFVVEESAAILKGKYTDVAWSRDTVDPDRTYTVTAVHPFFVELDYRMWISIWHLSQEKQQVARTSLQEVEVEQADGKLLYLYPNGPVINTLEKNQKLVIFAEWEDWYAIDEYDNQEAESSMYTQWVRKDVLDEEEIKEVTYLKLESPEQMTAYLSHMLLEGTTQEHVKEQLDEPTFIEQLPASSDRPITFSETWTYEQPDMKLTIEFNDERRLTDWSMTWFTSWYQSMYGEKQERTWQAFVPTKEADWSWKVNGELSHNYIVDMMDPIMLVYGDDGYISGMHYYSHLSALDMNTGDTVWTIEASFWGFDYAISSDRKTVAVYTDFNDPTWRMVDIRTGDILFEQQLEGNYYHNELIKGNNTFAMVVQSGDEEVQEKWIHVYDDVTGQQKWSKELALDETAVEGHSGDDFIVVGPDRITSYDTDSGAVVWFLEKEGLQPHVNKSIDAQVRGFDKPPSVQGNWFLFERELCEIQLITGTVVQCIAVEEYAKYEIINDTYIVLRSAGEIKSDVAIYDVNTAALVWSGEVKGWLSEVNAINNKIYFHAYTDQTILYVLDVQTGMLQEKPNNHFFPSYIDESNYFAIQSDEYFSNMYAVDRENDEILYRINNVKLNSNLYSLSIVPYDGHYYIATENGVIGKASF